MPWTNPIPSQPNKQWLYINNTTSILGNTANEDSLICWAYAQGYTGVILYQLNTLTGGGTTFTPANSTLLSAFINKCNSNGIEVGGAFGGPSIIQAIISQGGFTAAVSEIEWWNYSYNLPYQKQDGSGAYSFYDTLQIFMAYKSQLNNAGINLITYNGFTKSLNYIYQYKYSVTAEYKNSTTQGPAASGNLGFAINGNFTTDNSGPIIESKVFEGNQVIKINNWPSPNLSTYAKLDAANPVALESGKTVFKTASSEVSNGVIIPSGYRPAIQVSAYSITGAAYIFTVNVGHGILAGTRICTDYNANPVFNVPGGDPVTYFDINSVGPTSLSTQTNAVPKSNITAYQVNAGTTRFSFANTADASIILIGDTIGLPTNIVTPGGGGTITSGFYTVTNKGSNWIEFSTPTISNTAPIITSGYIFIQTRALVTLPSPVTFYPEFNSTSASLPTVSNLFEVTTIGAARTVVPGYSYEIALRGDKSYYFATNRVSKISIENYNISSGTTLFTVGGSLYDAGTNETVFFVAENPAGGSGAELTTFLAMANLDVVYKSNSVYNSPGSELQQLVPHVDSYALTVYEQNVPNYGYIKNRVREIGQGIATVTGSYTPKVYYLFGAYNQASLNFYKGLNALGNNGATPWPKKGAKEAYDYVSFTLSPSTPTINSPSQTGSPISAEAETDPDVQTWVQIEGLLMFKYTDFANQSIKNGPNILVGPTNPVLLNTVITATPAVGSTALAPLTFCDDCLPKVNVSSRSRTSGVATITTDTPHAFLATTSVVISGVGAGYDGTYTSLVPTSGNTFTISNAGSDEPTTSCTGTVTPETTVTWAVFPPVGGSAGLTTLTATTTSCSTSFPNTLSFNGAGLYTVTATVKNPLASGLNPNNDRLVTEVIEYQVNVLTSTPDPLAGNAVISSPLTCPNGADAVITASVNPAPNAGVAPYVYSLHSGSPPTPLNQIDTSGSTSDVNWFFTGLAAGTYFILITDSIGQTQTFTLTISADICNITTYVTNVSCAGGSNGEILLLTDAFDPECACGLGGFDYSWTYNGTAQPAWDGLNNITGLSAGFYEVTVTTCLGCEQIYTLEVLDALPITLDSVIAVDSTCGALNGNITAYLNPYCSVGGNVVWYGGTSPYPAGALLGNPYSIVFPPSYSGIDITNAVGDGTKVTYTTISNHGLFLGQLVYISGMSPSVYDTPFNYPTAVVTDIVSPTIFKIASTATGVMIAGGFLYLDFLNSPSSLPVFPAPLGSSGVSLINIPGGSYYFVYQSVCGCIYYSPTITTSASVPPTATITEPLDGYVICDSGSVTITGTITSDCAYTTSWTNVTSGITYSGGLPITVTYPPLPGGISLDKGNNNLVLQVTDCNGCTVSVSTNVLVTAPDKPVTGITYTGGPLTNCPGTTVPYVLTVQGGTIPAPGQGYWSLNGIPNYSLQDYPTLTVDNSYFTSNNPITFTYTQVDDNGCESSAEITIDPPIPISLTVVVKNNPCGGPGNLGEINVAVLNGCPPYSYSWTGPGGFTALTEDITGLINGTYQVTVTDGAGNIFISNPITIVTDIPAIDNLVVLNTCNNSPNGSISFDITGGTAPFTITWDSPQNPAIDITYNTSSTSVTLTGLKNGTYNFLLEDDYGCTISQTFVIQDAPPIIIDPIIWNPSCSSACDGSISLNITGGVGAPYTINWTNPSLPDVATVSNLCTGIYPVTVVDANGCSAIAKVTLTATPPIDFTEYITYPNFETGTLGSIQITSVTNGGGPPYTYVWTDENGNIIGTNALLSNLNDGTYTVTVTGYPGCYASRTYTILGRCTAFSYPEFRLQLYKFQCCAGQLAKKYVNLVNIGRMDLAECLEADLKYLTVTLDSLSCISLFPDPCLSCDDLNNIFNQMKKICDCDCCESDENAYTVRYDSETQTFIPIIPAVSGGGTNNPPQP